MKRQPHPIECEREDMTNPVMPSDEDVAREIVAACIDGTELGEDKFNLDEKVIAAILTRYREQAVAPLIEALEKTLPNILCWSVSVHLPSQAKYDLSEAIGIIQKSLAAHQPKKDNHDG